jgi:transcriptional regulator with XRE-family HTH domain
MAETHWTEESVDDFVHRLSFDFITQLAKRLDASPSTRAQLAERLGVSKGRISQILNNPGNLTLKRAVAYARALGLKVSVVAYDDQDPDNRKGPISSEIFSLCWQKAGRPADFQTVENIASFGSMATTNDNFVLPERKGFVLSKRSAKSNSQCAVVLDTAVLLRMAEQNASTIEQRSLAVGE